MTLTEVISKAMGETKEPNAEAMNPGVTPCGHRVLVWPLPIERKTKGGIALPDNHVEREGMAQVDARVMKVGPTCWADQKSEAWCKPGDVVKIAKYGGLVVTGLDGRTYRIINDLDVVGVMEVCDE